MSRRRRARPTDHSGTMISHELSSFGITFNAWCPCGWNSGTVTSYDAATEIAWLHEFGTP